MLNPIDTQLQKIRERKKIGIMTHVVVGYPTLNDTLPLIKTLADAGSDFIELQIPFSDPTADGPTIMHACEQSLSQGTRITDAFAIMKQASTTVDIPLLFMAYYNTIFHYGVKKFCKKAQEVGACGLIIPDIPPEEEQHEHFFHACKKYNLYPIRVVSPASSDERLKKNATYAQGFVYCVSRYGTTGAQKTMDVQLDEYLSRVRSIINLPLAVGFGISTRDQIQSLEGKADVAVIGSVIIDLINANQVERIAELLQ